MGHDKANSKGGGGMMDDVPGQEDYNQQKKGRTEIRQAIDIGQ